MAALVVAAEKEEGIGVPNLETPQVEHALQHTGNVSSQHSLFRRYPSWKRWGRKAKEEGTHLYGEVATVDVVTQEEVARIGGVASDLKELHQVELQGGGSA